MLAVQRFAQAQAPVLSISKTSSAGGSVGPGDVITYTIVVRL